MKYNVKFSCGHVQEKELFGKSEEREKKIAYFEKYGLCHECYLEQKDKENSIGCKAVEMSYIKYKQECPDCKTKRGSYNGDTKTIIVYIPYDKLNDGIDYDYRTECAKRVRERKYVNDSLGKAGFCFDCRHIEMDTEDINKLWDKMKVIIVDGKEYKTYE